MNVAQAKDSLLSGRAVLYHDAALAAATVLADEVERLRRELALANAEQERLENQLDSVRSELVAVTVKLDEWERVGLVAADISQMLRDDTKTLGSR